MEGRAQPSSTGLLRSLSPELTKMAWPSSRIGRVQHASTGPRYPALKAADDEGNDVSAKRTCLVTLQACLWS